MQALTSILALSLIVSSAPPADAPAGDGQSEAVDQADSEAEVESTPPAEVSPAADASDESKPDESKPDESKPDEPPADAPSTPEPEVEPPAPELDGGDTPSEPAVTGRDRLGCGGSKSCRRMSAAGIVVGSLGLIGVGIGIGLLVNPDKVVAEQPIFVNSTHPPGLVSVTICSGLALTSVLMLVAAHKGYKKRELDTARVQPLGLGFRF